MNTLKLAFILMGRSYCPNMQDKIINITYRLGSSAGVRLTDKNMSMSRPVYMHASIATPELAANHNTGNGLDHLHSHSWAGSQSQHREWTRLPAHCGMPWFTYNLPFLMLKSVFTLTRDSTSELHSSTRYNRTST